MKNIQKKFTIDRVYMNYIFQLVYERMNEYIIYTSIHLCIRLLRADVDLYKT